MKLKISYFKDTDTLWLSNELPTPVGEDITENVTVFFDMEKTQPNGVLIEHAAELLLPILKAATESSEDAVDQAATPSKAAAMPRSFNSQHSDT